MPIVITPEPTNTRAAMWDDLNEASGSNKGQQVVNGFGATGLDLINLMEAVSLSGVNHLTSHYTSVVTGTKVGTGSNARDAICKMVKTIDSVIVTREWTFPNPVMADVVLIGKQYVIPRGSATFTTLATFLDANFTVDGTTGWALSEVVLDNR